MVKIPEIIEEPGVWSWKPVPIREVVVMWATKFWIRGKRLISRDRAVALSSLAVGFVGTKLIRSQRG